MVEKNMVEIPYGDFVKLIKTAGRVEAALAVLRTETGNYVKCPLMNSRCDSCGAAEEDCQDCKAESKRRKDCQREREGIENEFIPD